VDVVESLAGYPDAAAVLAARVPAPQVRACSAALARLLAADVIRARSAEG
jgi:hypothetical protein